MPRARTAGANAARRRREIGIRAPLARTATSPPSAAWSSRWIAASRISARRWARRNQMIALAALTRLPPWLVGALGLVIIAGHNLFDARLAAIDGPVAWPWKLLYVGFYAGP